MPTKSNRPRFAMSKRARSVIFASCLILAVFLIWLDRTTTTGFALLDTAEKSTSSDIRKYHEKKFTVTNVVDGDTFDIDIPNGKYEHTRIRLWGVDTPETGKGNTTEMYFGKEASEFTRFCTLGKTVRLYLDEKRTRGYYGRLLAYIQLPDGQFLNELLLKEGYAYADLRFRHKFYNKYQQLQNLARSNKKGLWQNVTRNQLPQWLQEKRPKLLAEKQKMIRGR